MGNDYGDYLWDFSVPRRRRKNRIWIFAKELTFR
jgi:hypothetical protein